MRTEDLGPNTPHDIVTPKPKVVTFQDRRRGDVIEMLEAWLERAKAGEVVGLVAMAILSNDTSESDWSNGFDAFRLIGALAQAQHDIMDAALLEEP